MTVPIEDFGNPPALIYYDTSQQMTVVDSDDTSYGSMDARELEILLSLLNYSAAKARRELRRRASSGGRLQ